MKVVVCDDCIEDLQTIEILLEQYKESASDISLYIQFGNKTQIECPPLSLPKTNVPYVF